VKPMRYVSTRGAAPVLGFADTLLAGLATDGGLYVPEGWPELAMVATRPELAKDGSPATPYADTAVEVMWPFVEGSIEQSDFAVIVREAYSTFSHPDVTPLVELGDGIWLLELFHGPTLAFKDVALQLVGRLFDHELARRSSRVTIVGATSGDTGSAAIEACRDRKAIDIVILHPNGRVSEVQRRQMTTVLAPNVFNVAIDGTFDDCQDLVKAMFNDEEFRVEQQLSAVNSINWARVMAQIVYYVVATDRLGGRGEPISFSVPTGNFGNVFAGHGAKQMGLDIRQFVVGSNPNDILTQFFTTGEMTIGDVHPSLSPSMDIQVSSNLERLLFELYERDGAVVEQLMDAFRRDRHVAIGAARLAELAQTWTGVRIDDERTTEVMADTYERTGMLLDPHTAVGLGAAYASRRDPDIPMVTLATAHPAKFPDAVEQATGVRPALPPHLAELLDRPEQFVELPDDLAAVQQYVRAVTRR
jgi:threonine synthase